MARFVIRLGFWILGAFFFHVAAVSTPAGVVRLEWPFFLAVLCAVRDPKFPGVSFFLPSLLFDFMDGNFAGSLSHLAVFLLVRRGRGVMDFVRMPSSLVLAVVAAILDRLMFGFLVDVQAPDSGGVLRALLDPSFVLTACVLPPGIRWMRG